MTETSVITWVIGGGGLLGRAVVDELALVGRPCRSVAVPWSDADATDAALTAAAADIRLSTTPWRVMWCAGAAVVGATDETVRAELHSLEVFLSALASLPAAADGALFLASSAGGVYAGSVDPPFTELTDPAPISPYGHGKLAAEEIARRFARTSGTPVLIGRIANLYGPGQNLDKSQGLISQLCKAHLTRVPLSIYVSLDTARDYVFAADAARMALASLERVADGGEGAETLKIIASQRSTTVAAILGELRRLTRHRPRVTLGASPLARFQTRDLRFDSVTFTDLDSLATTSLPVGVSATMDGLAANLRASRRPA